jgi:pyruvate formate lyase activating enzyme
MHETLYYTPAKDSKVRCQLCPHNCLIASDRVGICRQRKNVEGKLYTLNYGQITSIHMDPMEKKPIYHFHPGEQVLSLGTNGCNLACMFCQNWSISQEDAQLQAITPEEVIKIAQKQHSKYIAYTYNEPFIWYEFVLETARLAREQGLGNIMVTNGFVNPEPLAELLPYINALNIDIKSIKPDFYHKICRGKLEPVLATAQKAKAAGALVEITNLVIPGENDDPKQFTQLAQWIANNLGKDTPLHFSSYFPTYKMTNPPTPVDTLLKAYELAKAHLYFVYLGNVVTEVGNDTVCLKCGTRLIERLGYQTKILKLASDGRCGQCGTDNNIILK